MIETIEKEVHCTENYEPHSRAIMFMASRFGNTVRTKRKLEQKNKNIPKITKETRKKWRI